MAGGFLGELDARGQPEFRVDVGEMDLHGRESHRQIRARSPEKTTSSGSADLGGIARLLYSRRTGARRRRTGCGGTGRDTRSRDDTMLEKININPIWLQCDDFLSSRSAQANVGK